MNVDFAAFAVAKCLFVAIGYSAAELLVCDTATAPMRSMCVVHVFETIVGSIDRMMAVQRSETRAVLVAVEHSEHLVPHLTPSDCLISMIMLMPNAVAA